jgi:hypothetical protein
MVKKNIISLKYLRDILIRKLNLDLKNTCFLPISNSLNF